MYLGKGCADQTPASYWCITAPWPTKRHIGALQWFVGATRSKPVCLQPSIHQRLRFVAGKPEQQRQRSGKGENSVYGLSTRKHKHARMHLYMRARTNTPTNTHL